VSEQKRGIFRASVGAPSAMVSRNSSIYIYIYIYLYLSIYVCIIERERKSLRTVSEQKRGIFRASVGAPSAMVSRNSSARWRSESSRVVFEAMAIMPLTHASKC